MVCPAHGSFLSAAEMVPVSRRGGCRCQCLCCRCGVHGGSAECPAAAERCLREGRWLLGDSGEYQCCVMRVCVLALGTSQRA